MLLKEDRTGQKGACHNLKGRFLQYNLTRETLAAGKVYVYASSKNVSDIPQIQLRHLFHKTYNKF